ncbi:MAG TPA: DUF2085 domain-containing protein [Thermoplasmata archaeon]
MTDVWSVLMFLGSSVCHQLPERSYFLGDLQMPLCARCTGIHLGLLVSATFLMMGPFRFRSGLPTVKQMIVLGAFMSMFFIDAGLSYSGISESTNLRRTVSGLMFGVLLPFLFVPLLNLLVFPKRDDRRILETPLAWAWPIALSGVSAGLIYAAQSLDAAFYAASLLGLVGMFVTFSLIVSCLVLIGFEKSTASSRTKIAFAVTIAVSALLAVASAREVLAAG